jgi:sugar/nucleoside kinase (ribokinase family)
VSRTARIQVVGHVCVDLKPGLPAAGIAAPGELVDVDALEISVGGAVGNCGRVLTELGHDVTLSAAVGDDELGAICRQTLARTGAEVDLAGVPGRATSYSIVVEPPGVDRSFWHRTGANDSFTGDCRIAAASLLHYGYPSLTPAMCAGAGRPIRTMFERAHRAGVATSLDLAYLAAASPLRALDWTGLLQGVLPACDVFCPSWDDLASSIGADADEAGIEAVAARAIAWGAAVVLLTLGERGSYLRTAGADRLAALPACGLDPAAWADRSLWAGAPRLQRVVTTNAAGDTFKAAFLAGLVSRRPPSACLGFAGDVVARHLAGRTA